MKAQSFSTVARPVFPSLLQLMGLVSIAPVMTATEVGVRAIQDHKVIEWNTCWKCRLSEGTDDM
jgi:hypothetical protein